MKHSNVAIFIPHVGCPHLCSFCNQRNISGEKSIPTGEDVQLCIRARLTEMKRNMAVIAAEIYYDNQVCSSADITYYCFTKEQSASQFYLTSCDLEEDSIN